LLSISLTLKNNAEISEACYFDSYAWHGVGVANWLKGHYAVILS